MGPNALLHQNIVCFGAGTGQRRILAALARHHNMLGSITAVVSTTDNGGHSGRLRTELNIPQVGDGRQCLLGLSMAEEYDTLRIRYEMRDPVTGECRGNAQIARYTAAYGITRAFAMAAQELSCVGTVLPATEANVDIVAHLTDGSSITGEWEIIERSPRTPIDYMSLSQDVPAAPDVLTAIAAAHVIVICPGSFYTGIVSTLLPRGIKDAIRASKARVVQVVNLMTQPGITDSWDAEEHIRRITPYLGRMPDAVVVNTGDIPAEVLAYYRERKSNPVIFNGARQHFPGVRFIEADLVPSTFSGNGERPGPVRKWTHLLTHHRAALLRAIDDAVLAA